MNPYKKRMIVEHVLKQGPLPKDQWGRPLSPADLLVWFGLSEALDSIERVEIMREFAAMVEAEDLGVSLRANADPSS